MSFREDREREERERERQERRAEKQKPMSPEKLTGDLKTLKVLVGIVWGLIVIMGILVVVALMRHPSTPKVAPQPTPAEALYASFDSLLQATKAKDAKIDSLMTVSARSSEQSTTAIGMVEQRAGDLDQLRKEFNHHVINSPDR